MADRLNTIPTIALDNRNNPHSIFPLGITGNDIKVYSIHTRDYDFIEVAMESYEVLGLDPGDGGDGGVGTSTVPPTVYSRSVGIGMPTAMKTKINNIQTILIGSSSLPAIRASPLATVTETKLNSVI